MWLINVDTLQLEEFIGKTVPKYAILSHTWGDGEVSFREMAKRKTWEETVQKPGFNKISKCCEMAALVHLKYAWVDTCCIDKKSSAELSEAINSMWQYYEEAYICFVHMADVRLEGSHLNKEQFQSSRWFTRGWTLQELLAPRDVRFFDQSWNLLGDQQTLCDLIVAATGIESLYLDVDIDSRFASVACKMSWASRRETTRSEDVAYCLMGLLKINMPLLYGEKDKAFKRLQTEFIKQHHDETIFAWTNDHLINGRLLASCPADFKHSGHVESLNVEPRQAFEVTNVGIRMTVRVSREDWGGYRAILSSVTHGTMMEQSPWLKIALQKKDGIYLRLNQKKLEFLTRKEQKAEQKVKLSSIMLAL
ncbi:uncharacterized protein KY384_008100 [Bacidia gigantensis]|uniref:uncharacterized protein n=1 Tax=Bacidia gigantensis TaxID=2732470 RepID=UPI001D050CA0|nr:uncharacterized protein KY384_008100 [Bacidia gigantensis]KAG8526671.1 hypothetical protein KY384_008100 [Bacidia gigantensis]